MATTVATSHQRKDRFDADFIVCRRLYVEEGFELNGDFYAEDIFCTNLTATQTVTANAVVTNTIAVPVITGVLTINGLPYPPTTGPGAAGGPWVDVANGAVFPTLVVPAGGSGAYRVTNASLAGMANNAPDPGFDNGGPLGAGLARIMGFGGDIAGRTELLLFNASNYVLRFFTPIVSINPARGRVWWPGTRARLTRPSTLSAAWVVEVDEMRFTSRLLDDMPTLAPRIAVDPGSTLVEGGVEYSLVGYSDFTTDDVLCRIEGVYSARLDRTGNPASNTGAIALTMPIGNNASSLWTPTTGFVPSFGTLDALYTRPGGRGAFQLLNRRHVGTGHLVDQASTTQAVAVLRRDLEFTLGIEMTGIAGLVDITAIVAFRFLYDQYEYIPTF